MLEIIERLCVWMSDRLEEIKEEVELLRDDMCVTSIEVDTSADAILDDMEWLINRVQELEEDNKNLQVLSSINRKEHMRIHEQNKRYREFLEDMYNHAYGLQLYPHAVDEIKKLLEETEDA